MAEGKVNQEGVVVSMTNYSHITLEAYQIYKPMVINYCEVL